MNNTKKEAIFDKDFPRDRVYLSEALASEAMWESSELHTSLQRLYTHCMIFIGMSLEAYIYDFGAILLSDAYIEKHLDRISFEDKWILYPHLVTKKRTDPSKNWYALLKKIVKTRNLLVHSKSVNITMSTSSDEYAALEDTLKEKYIVLDQAIKGVFLIDEFITPIGDKQELYLPLISPSALLRLQEKKIFKQFFLPFHKEQLQ